MGGKPKLEPFTTILFSEPDSSYFDKLIMIFLGPLTEVLDLSNFFKLLCFAMLFDAKILLLRLKNTKLT